MMIDPHEPETRETPAAIGLRRWRLLLGLAAIVAIAFAAKVLGLGELLGSFVAAVESMGFWGPLLFVVIYVVAAVVLVPGSVLTLGAGAAFGLWRGFALVSIASTLGAAAAFLVGRYLARERVAKRIAGNPRIAAVDEAIAREGWKIVALVRLTPIVPYTLLNYALSVTRVRFFPYLLASWAGMIPGTVMYVYLGSLGNAGGRGRTPAEWALLALGLLATVAVTVLITRAAKRALADRVGAEEKT